MSAAWRTTVMSDSQFLGIAVQDQDFVSALFCIPGFVASYISADLMHVADLGLLGVVLGNVVYKLLREMHGTNATRRSVCSELLTLMRVASTNTGNPGPS